MKKNIYLRALIFKLHIIYFIDYFITGNAFFLSLIMLLLFIFQNNIILAKEIVGYTFNPMTDFKEVLAKDIDPSKAPINSLTEVSIVIGCFSIRDMNFTTAYDDRQKYITDTLKVKLIPNIDPTNNEIKITFGISNSLCNQINTDNRYSFNSDTNQLINHIYPLQNERDVFNNIGLPYGKNKFIERISDYFKYILDSCDKFKVGNQTYNCDGIDFDDESEGGYVSPLLGTIIKVFSTNLHERGKIFTVPIMSKDIDSDFGKFIKECKDLTTGHNPCVDEIRFMTYDYDLEQNKLGHPNYVSISPLDEFKKSLDTIKNKFGDAMDRVYIGISNYARCWPIGNWTLIPDHIEQNYIDILCKYNSNECIFHGDPYYYNDCDNLKNNCIGNEKSCLHDYCKERMSDDVTWNKNIIYDKKNEHCFFDDHKSIYYKLIELEKQKYNKIFIWAVRDMDDPCNWKYINAYKNNDITNADINDNNLCDKNITYKKTYKCQKGYEYINTGEFIMDAEYKDDKELHKLIIKNGYCMKRHLVTVSEFQEVMGKKEKSFYSDCVNDCPFEAINWDQAVLYCEKIGQRLTTETEWEYAAIGGTKSKYYWGEVSKDILYHGRDTNGNMIPPARKNTPNGYGIYDMEGNMWEWVVNCDCEYSNINKLDLYDLHTHCKGRALRGRYYDSNTGGVNVSDLTPSTGPGYTNFSIGFRCVSK